MISNSELIEYGQKVIRTEIDAISRITLTDEFANAARQLSHTTLADGHTVVSGIGKSGLIGAKISATLASIGLPSHVLHPSEAFHGDIGKLHRGDCVLLLSYSGSTEEVVSLAEILRQDEVPTIAITRDHASALGRLTDHCIALGDLTEACPHDLAPTSTTTATLAVGDALALAASHLLNFSAEEFHRRHPSGNLGKLMTPVSDAIRFVVGRNLPLVHEDTPLKQAYNDVAEFADKSGIRRAGALVIVDNQGKLSGIMTDADFRRLIVGGEIDRLDQPIRESMITQPKTLFGTDRVQDAVHLVREWRIDEIPVVDAEGKPVGMLDIQDLIALKVISE